MTKKKSRLVRPRTQNIAVSASMDFEVALRDELKWYLEVWEDGDNIIKEILAIVSQYNLAIAQEKSLPSIANQKEDLRQLGEAINEVKVRLHSISFPPAAKEKIDDLLISQYDTTFSQEQDVLISRLGQFENVLKQIDLGSTTQTRPSMITRDEIFTYGLIQIYKKSCVRTSVANNPDKKVFGRKIDSMEFIEFMELVFNAIQVPLPEDNPRLIRRIKDKIRRKT